MKIGFIGTGKITKAIVKGFCTSGIQDLSISLSPRNDEVGKQLEETFENVTRVASNQKVIDTSDIIFLALRPEHFEQTMQTLKFKESHTVVSLIPFTTIEILKKAVSPATKISRAIPLPTVVNHNCPIPVFSPNKMVLELLSHLGQPLNVTEENQLHSIWVLTGLITPFYDLMGELTDWTIENGVEEKIANAYMADLFHSLSFAAQKAAPVNFEELSKHAATPNGLNEQAGKEIKENGSYEIFKSAATNLLNRFNRNFSD